MISIYLYSRMLCEGSPLFFYTALGPVTKPGLWQGALRVACAGRADRRIVANRFSSGKAGGGAARASSFFMNYAKRLRSPGGLVRGRHYRPGGNMNATRP